jgi:hypothetical protein
MVLNQTKNARLVMMRRLVVVVVVVDPETNGDAGTAAQQRPLRVVLPLPAN